MFLSGAVEIPGDCRFQFGRISDDPGCRVETAAARRDYPAGFLRPHPQEQLARIRERIGRMLAEHQWGIRSALQEGRSEGLEILSREEWGGEDRSVLRSYWTEELLPVLTPLAVSELDPPPLIAGQQLHIGLVVSVQKDSPGERLVVVGIPHSFRGLSDFPGKRGIALPGLKM